MDPLTIGLIISGVISVVTLGVNLLQSAKIHNITVSSCISNKKKSSSSSDSSFEKKKRRKKT